MKGLRHGVPLIALAIGLFLPAFAQAAPAPAWAISSVALPTNFSAARSTPQFYEVAAENRGGAATDGSPFTIVDRLPAGVQVERVELALRPNLDAAAQLCKVDESGAAPVVTCEVSEAAAPPAAVEPTVVEPGEAVVMLVYVSVAASASGATRNSVEVAGGGSPAAAADSVNAIDDRSAGPGLGYFEAATLDEAGRPVTQAGSHPFEFVTRFALNTEPGQPGNAPFVPAGGDIKDFEIALPPGLVGNPTAVTRCTPAEFAVSVVLEANGTSNLGNNCPAGSAVGLIRVSQREGNSSDTTLPIYNLVPPLGMPARLGFTILGAPFYIDTRVRTGTDYGTPGYLPNLSEVQRVTAAAVTLWGNPADPIHDPYRGGGCLAESPRLRASGISFDTCPAEVPDVPFFTVPTACGVASANLLSLDRWPTPGLFVATPSPSGALGGCSRVPFAPTIESVPRTTAAETPSGFDIDVHVPQPQDPNGIATAHLRDATVNFPPGVAIDPASADGLATCSPAQVGLTSAVGATPITFTEAPADCPVAAKIGTLEVDTPLLDHAIEGDVYVASQGDNPFGSLLAVYLVADDPLTGVVLKLPGRIEADPTSGRLVTRFTENPQLPFEDLKVNLFDGPRAPLQTPNTCGTFSTTSDLRPYSAPESGPDAAPSSSFKVTGGAGGGPCASTESDLPTKAGLQAGTVSSRAGTFSPFFLRVDRPDGSQRLARLVATLPEGLLASLRGIPYCSAEALGRISEAEGTGAAQASDPSCPAASRVGTVTVGAGAGPSPLYVGTGRAYLAGPYRGAPLSLAIVTPALAGPFDLGSVVVRTALRVDPETTQVTAVSDPLPTILHGIPLDLRDLRVNLDRPGFSVNPTDCEPGAITTTVTGTAGGRVDSSASFGASDCAALAFKPRIKLSLRGGTRRGKFPALRAAVLYPKGGAYANVSRAVVTLPRSEFLEQGHIGTVCTRVQFAAGAAPGEGCPARSVYGHARAFSPLLDQPLSGRVYLRSSSHTLPDLVVVLGGQIDVVLAGRIDSVNGGIRTSFEAVPDAAVSRFVLSLPGGKKGLIVNSRNICQSHDRAHVQFNGQNGRIERLRPKVSRRCHQPRPR